MTILFDFYLTTVHPRLSSAAMANPRPSTTHATLPSEILESSSPPLADTASKPPPPAAPIDPLSRALLDPPPPEVTTHFHRLTDLMHEVGNLKEAEMAAAVKFYMTEAEAAIEKNPTEKRKLQLSAKRVLVPYRQSQVRTVEAKIAVSMHCFTLWDDKPPLDEELPIYSKYYVELQSLRSELNTYNILLAAAVKDNDDA